MLDVGTGGQSSSTEWLREEQQQLCLWVAAPIRNSRSEIPNQKFPISFIPASSWKGGLPNLGRSPRGKLPGKGFLHGSSLKGVGTVDPRRRERGKEGGGDCWDYLQVVQLNSQERELDPGFGLEGSEVLSHLPCHGQESLTRPGCSKPIQPDPEHCQGWGVGNSLSKDEKLLFLREFLREELMPRDVQQHTWPCRTSVVLQLSGISVWRGWNGTPQGWWVRREVGKF